ncbi:class I SAM-dependent methyltransferase [Streptomyces olivaceus]|uniref:class I SAM-dependent methyltransferase n=1 Tax=Streptomyces olivaceus TaxID=47716 RepID=UPI0036F61CA9
MRMALPVTEWDAHYAAGGDFRPVTSEEEVAFNLNVGPGDGLSALDIGCGTGGFARFLRERGYSVRGVDYAGAAISLAQSRHEGIAQLSFDCWNAEERHWKGIPSYDLISCRLSYAFIQEKGEFLNNVRGHLSPGGVFHVMTPHADRLPPTRRDIGVSAEEVKELCMDWNSVKEYDLDAHHVCYTLTL